MANIYVIQLVGVLLTALGMVALTASAKLFGTPATREQQRKSGQGSNSYSLPINWTTLASGVFFLGGIGILTWSKFNVCSFLNHWMPGLPEAIQIFMSC